MKKNKRTRVGSEAQYGPRPVGEILHNYLESNNEPLAVAYREHSAEAEEQGWNRNTDLAVDLKTVLRCDRSMKTGKEYLGVLRRDSDDEIVDFCCRNAHYTFTEVVRMTASKRNPHIFEGKYVTVTLKDDGTLRPNFRPLKVGKGFSVGAYAIGVCRELYQALKGLVEE